jgi:hypothetical protein
MNHELAVVPAVLELDMARTKVVGLGGSERHHGLCLGDDIRVDTFRMSHTDFKLYFGSYIQ